LAICWLVGALSLPAATGLIGSAGECATQLDIKIEVIDEADGSKRFFGGFDSDNTFRFPDLPPGLYSIKFDGRYLKRHAIRVLPGAVTDLGTVTECIHISDHELLRGGGRHWEIEMTDLCEVNLRAPGWCVTDRSNLGPIAPFDDGAVVFWFHTTTEGAWVIPFKGASLSLVPANATPQRGCPLATYMQERIRLDSLPSGSRACLRSDWGGYYELRLPEKIAPNQAVNVELWDLGY